MRHTKDSVAGDGEPSARSLHHSPMTSRADAPIVAGGQGRSLTYASLIEAIGVWCVAMIVLVASLLIARWLCLL